MYEHYDLPKRANVADTLADKPEHHRIWAGDAVNQNRDEVRIREQALFGANSFVDSEIGRVVSAIDRYAPNALVIYTADHGDMLHSHCLQGKGPAMYEEITRVPLIVRWPGRTPERAASLHPVSHIDLTPSILAVFDQPIPAAVDGRSMLETFRRPEFKGRDTVFMEFGRYEVDHDGFGGFQPIRAACDGRYKLVINLLTSDELYDLQSDPDELHNRIADPALATHRARLHAQILDWMNQTRDPFRGYYWERRPWNTDASPATWKYTGYTRQREDEDYEPRQLDYGTGLEMTAAHRPK
jgi:uncharacterized sulfatase